MAATRMMWCLILTTLSACSGIGSEPRDPRPSPYEPPTDDDPRHERACEAAWKNLEAHKCRHATLKNGRTFKDFCIEKMNKKEGAIPLAPRCIASLTTFDETCSEVESVCNK